MLIYQSFDGFALNLNDPDANYAKEALNFLFGYADYRGFKLFLSIDLGGDTASVSGTCTSTSTGKTMLTRDRNSLTSSITS